MRPAWVKSSYVSAIVTPKAHASVKKDAQARTAAQQQMQQAYRLLASTSKPEADPRMTSWAVCQSML